MIKTCSREPKERPGRSHARHRHTRLEQTRLRPKPFFPKHIPQSDFTCLGQPPPSTLFPNPDTATQKTTPSTSHHHTPVAPILPPTLARAPRDPSQNTVIRPLPCPIRPATLLLREGSPAYPLQPQPHSAPPCPALPCPALPICDRAISTIPHVAVTHSAVSEARQPGKQSRYLLSRALPPSAGPASSFCPALPCPALRFGSRKLAGSGAGYLHTYIHTYIVP